MEPIAARLTSARTRRAAHDYATRPPMTGGAGAPLPIGATIAVLGIPGQKIASCADCHGPTEHRRNDAYPILAGQDQAYCSSSCDCSSSDGAAGAATPT